MKEDKNTSKTIVRERELLKIVCDLADALEIVGVNAKRQIRELIDAEEQSHWNVGQIKWTEAQGASGPYERSDAVGNSCFEALLKDLAAHQGKLFRDDHFYWIFPDNVTVGRKKRKQT